jgi:hypothetical protein
MKNHNHNQLAKSNQQLTNPQEQSIGAWIKTQEERDIYLANFGKTLQHFSTNADMDGLKNVIVQWVYTLGLSSKIGEKDIFALTKITKDLFPKLTIKDIQLAIKLSLQNKLGIDIECYGNFSALYISKILNAYCDYNHEKMQEIIWRKESFNKQLDAPKEEKPYEERLESTKRLIIYYGNWVKNNDTYLGDYNNVIWEFLKRIGYLDPTKVNLEEAEQWADDRIKLEAMSTQAKVFSKLSHEKREKEFAKFRRLYGRYYVMKKIFREIDNVTEWLDRLETKQILLE